MNQGRVIQIKRVSRCGPIA